MNVRLTWVDCDEVGDYVVPNVLSPRDLESRPGNMGETVLHKHISVTLYDNFTNISNLYRLFCDHMETDLRHKCCTRTRANAGRSKTITLTYLCITRRF